MSNALTPVGLISYFFPPIGMAGPARAYALFRYLPEFGYRPYVVTVKDILYAAYDSAPLSADDSEYIIRTESYDPARLLHRLGFQRPPAPNRSGKLSRWATPDFKKRWNSFALQAARGLIRERGCELFITTSPPPSTHQVGLTLKQKHGVTWIADFRDMWVTNPIERAYTSARQQRYARRLLKEIQSAADDIVAVNGSVAAYVGAEEVIENGADPDTFALWDETNRAPHDHRLHIGYFGATDRVDSIRLFCQSLKSALEQSGCTVDQAQVLFVGRVDEEMLKTEFASAGLNSALRIAGYLSRHDGVRKVAQTDALLVTTPASGSPHMTTSKIFDYLVSGKQILALTPENTELAQLLHREHIATYSEPSREDLVARLQLLLQTSARGKAIEKIDAETIRDRRERYSWRTLAKRYAEMLDRRTGKAD